MCAGRTNSAAGAASHRKLFAAAFISLDGVIQAPGGPGEDPRGGFRFGGWSAPFADRSADPMFEKIYLQPQYDLLLGKRTYEIFAAHWPDNEDNPIGEKFRKINKYVLTHSREPLSWVGSQALCGSTAEVVAALKQTEGRDLLLQGSSSLYPALLAGGFIDRLVLMIHPVFLGRGRRLFHDGEVSGALRLVEHFVSNTGVIFATYEPAGTVQTGTFETKEPSEAERQRRQAWAARDA